VKQAIGTMAGITRYAASTCRWTRDVVGCDDISGRRVVVKVDFPRDKEANRHRMVREWFKAFAINAGVTLSRTPNGENQPPYRRILFRGLARAASARP